MKKKIMVIADTAELKAAFTEWQKLNSKAQKAAAAYADKAAALKVKHDTATAPMAERMAELEAGIKAYATAHKAELTDGTGKTTGFHLSSLYSPVGWRAWGDIAAAWEAAVSKESGLVRRLIINGRTVLDQ